ncbi:CocE/NonD family hydrolase, partial [Streptomyces sp. NPDC001939]
MPDAPSTLLRHLWIPLADGTRLAARVWLPAAGSGPAPAVLEYIPYRKNDATAARDNSLHARFAEAGPARIEQVWQYLYKGAYWRRGPV